MGHDRSARDALLVLAALLASGCQALVGQRTFGGDWSPVENQGLVGLSLTTRPRAYGLRPELGGIFSTDRANPPEVEAKVTELFAGVRKNLGETDESDTFQAYAGTGISFIHAELKAAGGIDDEDDTVGVYVHAGIQIAPMLAIDVRFVFGTDLDFSSGSHDADGMAISLLIGPPTMLDEFALDE